MTQLAAPLIIGAATVRLTLLLSRDEVTQPIRDALDVAAVGAPHGSLVERLSYLFSCHKCTSVWAATAVVGAWTFGGRTGRALVQALAASQAAVMIIEAIDGEDE